MFSAQIFVVAFNRRILGTLACLKSDPIGQV
jgi:hypothetical protein